MPTYTIYADDNMAEARSTSATYADAREGTGSLAWDDTSLTNLAGQSRDLADRTCAQVFMHFDTSVVEVGAPDGGVQLTLFVSRRQHAEGKVLEIGANSWVAADTTDNFVAGSALSSSPEFGTIALPAASGFAQFDLNGPADVARSAAYGVMVWGQDQRNNVDITVGTNYWDAWVATTRAPNTTLWPYLTFEFPFRGIVNKTLDDIGFVSEGNLDCVATAAIALGEIGQQIKSINGVRTITMIALDEIGSNVVAEGLVPTAQPGDRQISFSSNVATARTITLED